MYKINKSILWLVILVMFLGAFGAAHGERPDSKKISNSEKIGLLKKHLKNNPVDVKAICTLGELYLNKRKRRKAINLFKKSIKLEPEYPPPYYFLGKTYIYDKKSEKGIDQFEIFEMKMEHYLTKDDSLKQFYITCLSGIGYQYGILKNYDEMLEKYIKMIDLDQDNQNAYYNLAICYYKYFQNLPKAFNALEKVVEIDTDRKLSNKAEFFIEFMRKNPDARYTKDFSFIYDDR